MLKGLYSVYDMQQREYKPPYVASTDVIAVRIMQQVSADPQTLIYQYPEDYSLHKVSEWDDESGEVYPCKSPVLVARMVDIVRKKEEKDESAKGV